MRKMSGRLVAVNLDVTIERGGSEERSRIEEMRTRVQHMYLGAPFINENVRRVPACMPPNLLAVLGPRGEQTPSHDKHIPGKTRGGGNGHLSCRPRCAHLRGGGTKGPKWMKTSFVFGRRQTAHPYTLVQQWTENQFEYLAMGA
jgi:hypothetical protein